MKSQSPLLDKLLEAMVAEKASDLHLAVSCHPILRIHGSLVFKRELAKLESSAMEQMLYPIMDVEKRERLDRERNVDFSYTIPGVARFRVNVLWQRDTLGAVFRLIPPRPLTLQELALPAVLGELAMRPRGLVIVAGPTGSGKSTTLAAMVDYINNNVERHIITIEDPIEYLHTDNRCLIRQREVGSDTPSFELALRYSLREDPDVIMVGEMRDLETIAMAVTAAETGHLVLATLHTTSAASTVDRIIDVFPPGQQSQIRLQLSNTLEGVLCQTLLPRSSGDGRVCAMEVMLGVPAVKAMIREAKSHQLLSVIESNARLGMQSLNMDLKRLVLDGVITVEAAMERTSSPDNLASLLGMAATRRVPSR